MRSPQVSPRDRPNDATRANATLIVMFVFLALVFIVAIWVWVFSTTFTLGPIVPVLALVAGGFGLWWLTKVFWGVLSDHRLMPTPDDDDI